MSVFVHTVQINAVSDSSGIRQLLGEMYVQMASNATESSVQNLETTCDQLQNNVDTVRDDLDFVLVDSGYNEQRIDELHAKVDSLLVSVALIKELLEEIVG